jgi:hypothetical protein
MNPNSKLAAQIGGKAFIITAEYLPVTGTEAAIDAGTFGSRVTAVNVADNHYGVSLSSLAGSMALTRADLSDHNERP